MIARAMTVTVGVGTTDRSHWANRAQALLAPLLHAAAVHGREMETVFDWVMRHERDLRAVIAEGGPAAADAHERLELLLANGQLAPAEERLMGTIGRAGKVAVTAADFDAEWQRTAQGIGFTPERVEALRRRQHQPLRPAAPDRVLRRVDGVRRDVPAREARGRARALRR